MRKVELYCCRKCQTIYSFPVACCNDKLAKRAKRFYCHTCLRKFRAHDLAGVGFCPHCNVMVRSHKTKVVAQVVTRLLRQRGLQPKPKKSDYEAYIASPQWRQIRLRVLERDEWACQACERKAEVVHHKSYDRDVLDGLRDSALVSLCHDCHSFIEFTRNENGKRVKNGLRKANEKLEALLKADTPQRPAVSTARQCRGAKDASNQGHATSLQTGVIGGGVSPLIAECETTPYPCPTTSQGMEALRVQS